MLLTFIFGAIGAVIGALNARRRGGKRLDILQYAAAHGMAFAIVGLFVTVFLSRAG